MRRKKQYTHILVPASRQDGVRDPRQRDEKRRLSRVRHDVGRDGVLDGQQERQTSTEVTHDQKILGREKASEVVSEFDRE